ncbi:MAG: Heavy metal efflux outer membrane protein, CzcC family protein [bacterium]|nr:Heavy metal efflux outer membrane protein, CzcC family protein [bacterium]
MLAVTLVGRAAYGADSTACAGPLTRTNLVPCVLAASLPVQAQIEQLAATAARRRTARLWFPSPASFSALAAARFTPPAEQNHKFANWYLTLEQEIETGGERAARLRAADAGIAAQSRRLVVTRRDAVANAWITWFDALASEEQVRLLRRTEALLARVATAARATAERGLLAPIDADTADAQALRAAQARAAAERRLAAARAVLAMQLGRPPDDTSLTVDGELVPVRFAAELDRVDVNAQPEVQALVADQRFQREQASLFRRLRAPNLVLSLTAENDGPNEKVVGAGVALPVPLPEPLGRLHSGDIAEAEALARRAAVEAEQERRRLRAEVAIARQAYHSLADEVARYTPARIAQAHRSLETIADQITAGRLAVRDALLAQQALLDLLLSDVEARHALCLASVDLARAAGVALERNPR